MARICKARREDLPGGASIDDDANNNNNDEEDNGWVPVSSDHKPGEFRSLNSLSTRDKMLFSLSRCSPFPFATPDEQKHPGFPGATMWVGYEYGYRRASYSGFRIQFTAALYSPALESGEIRRQDPFTQLDSSGALKHMRRWAEACISQHPGCKLSFSGEEIDDERPWLPTRVLDVGTEVGGHTVRLHEPQKEERGRFIALSHSWGPPEMRPIITTTDTRETWIQGIPWDKLPKTFQQAVLVTQALGVRYLWIDSLCIVQDDGRDWERESPKMSHIYQESVLTVIASYATDSSQGLFRERPQAPEHAKVELPHTSMTGEQKGVITVRLDLWDEEPMPEREHLWTRGWVTQELVLSRRKIFFTKDTMIWSCHAETQTETGEACPLQRMLDPTLGPAENWEKLVGVYSGRNLTYASDRLVAIQGLVDEMQRKEDDVCIVGHWKRQMPVGLLWSSEGGDRANDDDDDDDEEESGKITEGAKIGGIIAEQNALVVPTWSWASIGRRVVFSHERRLRPECSISEMNATTLIIPNALLLSVVHHKRSWKTIERKGVFSMPLSQRIQDIDLEEGEQSEEGENNYEVIPDTEHILKRGEKEIQESDLVDKEYIVAHKEYIFLLKDGFPAQKLKVKLEVTFDGGKKQAERLADAVGGAEYMCLAIGRRRLRHESRTMVLLLRLKLGLDSTYVRVGCGTLKAQYNAF